MTDMIEKPLWRLDGRRLVRTGKTISVPRPPVIELPTREPNREPPRKPAPPRPVRRKTLIQRIKEFRKVIRGPLVDDTVYEERLRICMSNECGYLQTIRENRYCGACGCPRYRLSELTTKLRFARLECPCDTPFWLKIDEVNGERK